jgi:hypothetical protein
MVTAKDMTRFFSPEDQCPIVKMGMCDGAGCRQFYKRYRSCDIKVINNRRFRPDHDLSYLKHFNPRNHWINCEFWNTCAIELTLSKFITHPIVLDTLLRDPDAGTFIKGRFVPLLKAIKETFNDPLTMEDLARRYNDNNLRPYLTQVEVNKMEQRYARILEEHAKENCITLKEMLDNYNKRHSNDENCRHA